ncbi:hypothetical protein AAF712_002850 [Marasmius tenuissimus]|uniref:Uncharacterized protein n=1 Tax=Marasmius tenuissimus TaxID=585030 RepID=A0ABR3A8V8_9AGAR
MDVTINAILLFWVSGPSTISRSEECTDRFSLPPMDMGPLAVLDSTAQARTGTTLTGTTMQSPTMTKFPEEMYDYIPKDHRHQMDEEEGEASAEDGRVRRESEADDENSEGRSIRNEVDAREMKRESIATEVSTTVTSRESVEDERIGKEIEIEQLRR